MRSFGRDETWTGVKRGIHNDDYNMAGWSKERLSASQGTCLRVVFGAGWCALVDSISGGRDGR